MHVPLYHGKRAAHFVRTHRVLACGEYENVFKFCTNQLGANSIINVADPWKIPWGQQVDLNASYRFNIAGVKATLYGNVNNLFNYNYVVDAYTDNTTRGTWENAYRVFYSFGRTYSVRMQINF